MTIKKYKRWMDLGLLIAFGPVILTVVSVVALLVYWKLGRPVLFVQERPGLHERKFKMYKFRTMSDARDLSGQLLSDKERLSEFGKGLRASSLDELPELYNVLIGEMSLVGPRPLLTEYLPLYSPRQARRHEVLPGVTGWAQVNGRNAAAWGERLEMDVWYVDHQSFLLDVRILIRSLWKIILREGISTEGHATSPRFTGQR